jgi:hypothetical protein
MGRTFYIAHYSLLLYFHRTDYDEELAQTALKASLLPLRQLSIYINKGHSAVYSGITIFSHSFTLRTLPWVITNV